MSKTFALKEIADAIGGRLLGDGSLTITRLTHPADARDTGDLALATDPKLLRLLKENIAAVVAGDERESDFLAARIIVSRPRVALAHLTALFAEPVGTKVGIHLTAEIEPGVKIGLNVSIGAFVYIGAHAQIGDNAVLHPQCYIGEGAQIGSDTMIHAGVKIGARTVVGDRVIIHYNASIGADGFSFVTPQTGSVEAAKATSKSEVTASNTSLLRIASLAPVILGDDVEIGANTTIDRGTIAPTRIGKGTKIDNQVQIGHNVTIGENCMICGRTGIAGSVTIGNRVVLGGATGVADHVTIGDDAIAMAMSGIAGNVPPRAIVGGIPAAPREKTMENLFNISRLKLYFKKIEEMGKKNRQT